MILSEIRQLRPAGKNGRKGSLPLIITTSPPGGVFTIRERLIKDGRCWVKFTLGLFRSEPRWIEVDPDDYRLLPIGTRFSRVGSRSARKTVA